MNAQTDTILEALRAVIGTTVIVDSASIAIHRTPETDLLLMPQVDATNYPLVALEVVEVQPGVAPERESVRTMSVGVIVAMHAVARYDDMDAHPTLASPREYARKFSEALDALIGAAPDLSSSIVGEGTWLGAGEEVAAREDLHGQGLCSYSSVWRFDYGTDRP